MGLQHEKEDPKDRKKISLVYPLKKKKEKKIHQSEIHCRQKHPFTYGKLNYDKDGNFKSEQNLHKLYLYLWRLQTVILHTYKSRNRDICF